MPERTLEERFRLLAAAFRDDDASERLRSRLGPGFANALGALVDALWRDVASAPKDLDREKVASLLGSVLPGRLVGNEPWAADVPDVAEAFLQFVAREESLATAWEWSSAVEENRAAFASGLGSARGAGLGPATFKPDRRPAAKIGRNDPCFCGSGRKYKHCCLKLLP